MTTHSAQETQDFAGQIVQKLRPTEHATLIALEGELGAGKTTFTQGFVKALSIEANIKSPTFVLMKEYDAPNGRHLIHIDCYRINDPKEMEPLGISSLLKDSNNILLIEWPERIAELLPTDRITIHIDHVSEQERKITVTGLYIF